MKKSDPAKERLWQHIEAGIKTDGLYQEHNREALARAIRDLIQEDPGKDLWALLQENIAEYTLRINTRKIYTYLSGVAAAIIICVSTILVYQNISHKGLPGVTDLNNEESVESFLTRICSMNPPKCSEAGFIELKSEILNLYNVKSEVANSIFSNPADADIMRVNERIDNQIKLLKFQIIEYVE